MALPQYQSSVTTFLRFVDSITERDRPSENFTCARARETEGEEVDTKGALKRMSEASRGSGERDQRDRLRRGRIRAQRTPTLRNVAPTVAPTLKTAQVTKRFIS